MSGERYHRRVFYDMVSNQYVMTTFDAKKKTWSVPAWQTESRNDRGAEIAYLKGKIEAYEKLLKDKGLIKEEK